MKKTIILLSLMMLSSASCTQEKIPQASLAPPPAIVSEPESKNVCITDAKTGKETCRVMKIHKKLDGTPVPKK